jgi:hypothetical protein
MKASPEIFVSSLKNFSVHDVYKNVYVKEILLQKCILHSIQELHLSKFTNASEKISKRKGKKFELYSV